MAADLAVSAAVILVERVSIFINQEVNLKTDVQSVIDLIKPRLTTMQAYLNDHQEKEATQLLQDRVRQIRDYAHEIEDIIDEFMFDIPQNFHRHRVTKLAHNVYHHRYQREVLHKLSSRIKDIEKKIDNYAKLNFLQPDTRCAALSSTSSDTTTMFMWSAPVSSWTHQNQENLVGFRSHQNDILKQLLPGDSTRVTLSVVGPPGSGKTFLVENMYQHPSISGQFQCRAWVRASRSLKRKDILSSILSQTNGSVGVDISRGFLHSHLQDKKYLIVLDDVWRNEDWMYIAEALPRGFKGSRIIVTSCYNDVAESCVENHPNRVHRLQGLTWKDARNLFCMKAFPTTSGECPQELEDLALKFVKKCEGSPSALTTVAGLLSKKPQIPSEWNKVYSSLGTDMTMIRSILPRYENLQSESDIKSCFLYFGVLPEDSSFQRERLIRLWIAEGFITKERERSLEEVAEDILNELVQGNLVHVSKRDVDGRVRSCRVLNLVREFIISVSEKEKFIRVIGDASLTRDKVRRLSLVADDTMFFQIQAQGDQNLNHVRSAFVFGKKSNFNFELFKLLRVLDMQGSDIDRFPEEILRLCLLRYLSLQNTKIHTIPTDIYKLSLLETLDLKQTLITRLPKSIFRLCNLRYLLVYHYAYNNYLTFDGAKGVVIGDSIATLTLLEKLSLIKVNARIVKQLVFLIKLRKLGIIGLKEKDGKILCESLQKMARLSSLDVRSERQDVLLDLDNIPDDRPTFEFLQRLHLKGRLQKVPEWIPTLQSLIKISLMWSRLSDDPLLSLMNLPNLMELKMIDAYMGEHLEFSENTFQKLKILHIEEFSELRSMLVLQKAMPVLEKLTICKCGNMKNLPIGIERLVNLQEFQLYDMANEFNERLRYADRSVIQHIRVIQSYYLSNGKWARHNLTR